MDKIETLLSSFDTWTQAQAQKSNGRGRSADNISLHGISRLRELILDLAVRGKLVTQKSNNLIEDIIKGYQSRNSISINENIPHRLPQSWIWAKFNDVARLRHGHQFMKEDFVEKGIPVIKIGQCKPNGTLDLYNCDHISYNRLEEFQDYLINKGDLLMALTGGTLGKVTRVNKDYGIVVQNYRVGNFFVNDDFLTTDFLNIILESELFQGLVKEKINQNAQPNIGKDNIEKILMPIPPIEEQHRIVAKVDELMALCDQLEEQQMDHYETHQLLIETLLNTLTQAKDATELETAWQRMAQHFDDLFTTEESIDQLKQIILQLAVMGKLVPQNPEHEPASKLLEKIAAEKERLVKEGKVKKEKPFGEIKEEKIPFKIPETWEWCRMQDLCPNISSGSTPPKQYFTNEGIPYLKVYNIRNQKIDFQYREQYVDQEYHSSKLKRSILNPGDVIMNIVGPPLGKTAIIPDENEEWNCNQAIAFFKPIIKNINVWLYTFLCAGTFLDDIELIGTAGQDNISVTKSKNILVPLPPINEQHQIVSKVDELFAFCNDFKERISKSRKIQVQLADGVVSV